MIPKGRGAAREKERLRYTYRRRLAGLSDDELDAEAVKVGEQVERLKQRLHELEAAIAALDVRLGTTSDERAAPPDTTQDECAARAGTTQDERAADEERRHELHAEHQRLYLDLTTDLFRKQAALSAEEVRRWGGD